ncbi:hypothetical protein [Telluria beijingensis]|uniref:hypothetical protein n=1 Tax=Telluria beijingensis TaxID=3068633 RepID=UPI002795518B|nr:hypothetical protein [Massilia sp. REN29]
MKQILLLCALACAFTTTASAQTGERPKSECLKACNAQEGFKGMERIERKLAEVRDKKKDETDPRKLEQLAEQEQDLVDERDDRRQDVCNYICEHNPAG